MPSETQPESMEELYGLTKKDVDLHLATTKTHKFLHMFRSPGEVTVSIDFPEFTCLCPKTSQPDFANITIRYIPKLWCVELKSLKYYLNSFRNEGHFHEEVTRLMYEDLQEALKPEKLRIVADFNVRGGTYPTIEVGDDF